MKYKILALDDQLLAREAIARALADSHQVTTEKDPERALAILNGQECDLVIVDLIMPQMDGVTFLRKLREFAPNMPAIIVSASEDVAQVVDAFREQPFDFLRKPVDPAELQMTVNRALSMSAMHTQILELQRELSGADQPQGLVIGTSGLMQRFWAKVKQVAELGGNSSVLVLGESGTGKEVVARAIHRWSPRADKQFISVNCGLLDAPLSAAQLFGIERGVATGVVARAGKFEAAEGGTLMLDEIGDLDPTIQIQLLRILQERTFSRIGSNRDRYANVRVVAATNVDLKEAVRRGTFRQDLFYRLSVVSLSVPPLRAHIEDIPELTIFLLKKHGRHDRKRIMSLISKSLFRTLQSYDWPGNIRQLENTVINMLITGKPPSLSQLKGEEAHLPDSNLPPGHIRVVGRSFAEIEEEILRLNMDACKGKLAAVSRSLGIPRSTLYERLHRFGIK